MTSEWMYIQTANGITHAFRRRQYGSPRWIAACGERFPVPDVISSVNNPVDCMACLVHQE